MNESGEESGKRSSAKGVALAVTVWLLGIGVFVLGARRYLPEVASEHGKGIDVMLIYLLVTTGSLIVIGHLVLGYFVFRFSRAARVSPSLPGPAATRFWSVAPAILMSLVAEGGVLVLGIPVFGQLYTQEAPADSVVVEVTGEQFTWNVRYPGRDGRFGRTDPALITTENALGVDPADPAATDDIHELALIYVPVNRPVKLLLRSKDVLHSFFLPHHRVKQDAVPGMTIEMWFVPDREGEFEIACTELCGFGHYQMRGFLRVVSDQEFERYLVEKEG